MKITKRIREIFKTAENIGVDATADKLGLTRETVRRNIRFFRKNERDLEAVKESLHQIEGNDIIPRNTVIQQIQERYSDKELKAIADGYSIGKQTIAPIHSFENEEVAIGVLSDTHFGSKYTNPEFCLNAFDEFAKNDVQLVVHNGDVTEGMSHRAGHIYECTHLGYDAQKEHAIEILRQWTDTPFYMISGNHDAWFTKSNGALIVKDICAEIPNAEYLGYGEGNIKLSKNANMMLWHGEDGSSYALSYRLQKIIEAFTGGEKPAVLLAGHVHKAIYMYLRHVHCLSAGAIQAQTKWMRMKRISSHTGFWIIWVGINKKGVSTFRSQFYPFYV